MNCKILTDFGYFFVCLPSGRKIPKQTRLTISQDYNQKGRAKVVFRAITDPRVSPPKIERRGLSLWVEDEEIPFVLSDLNIPPKSENENEEIEVVILCDVCETQERPFPLRTV